MATTSTTPTLTDDDLCCQEMLSQKDADWFDLRVLRGSRDIGDELMKKYCDYYRVQETTGKFKIAYDKPLVSQPMFIVPIGVLPKNLRELIDKIRTSWTVVDTSARADQITGALHGNMRAWHQNGDNMLPKHQGPVPTLIISVGYQTYIGEHKGLPTKQRAKGIKEEYTGYVEYTLRSWRSSQGRMVYDYYNNRFFLTPGHYGSGDKDVNAFYLIQLD